MSRRIHITSKLRQGISTFIEINSKSGKMNKEMIAKKLGISRNSLYLIYSGKTQYLNPETWNCIKELMGLSLSDDSHIPKSFSVFVDDAEPIDDDADDPMLTTRLNSWINRLEIENNAQKSKLIKHESTIQLLTSELKDAQKTVNAIKGLVGIEDLTKVRLMENIKNAEQKLEILKEKQIQVQKLMDFEREKTFVYMTKGDCEKFELLIEELNRLCSDHLITWEKEMNYSIDLMDSSFNDAKKYIDENFTPLIPHEIKIQETLNLMNERIINNRNEVFEDMFTKLKQKEN